MSWIAQGRSQKDRLAANKGISIDMKSKQKGAALIVVLSMLTASLMLGLTSMQSSMIDERLAGNYKAAAQAQMAAEEALSQGWKQLKDGEIVPEWLPVSDFSIADIEDMDWDAMNSGSDGGCIAPMSCFYQYIEAEEGGKYIVAMGSVLDGGMAKSAPVIARVVNEGGGDDGKGVVGCEAISLGGGPQIDSYNSSFGAYGESVNVDGQSFVNSQRQEAVVKTIAEGSSISLSGNSPIYGRVEVPGDLSLNSGTPVYGSVVVDGSVDMNGSIYGSLVAGGGIAFGSASTMEGDVTAGGNVVIGSTGNPPSSINAAGSVSYPDWWKWDDAKMALADQYLESQSLSVPKVYNDSSACDTIGVTSQGGGPGKLFDDAWGSSGILSTSSWFDQQGCVYCYSTKGGRFSFSGGSGNKDASTTQLGTQGEKTYIRIDQDVTTGGRLSQLLVKGDVTMVVDGDFDLGNNTQLVVDEGATLTILVTGKAKLGGGSSLLSSSAFVRDVDGEGKRAAVALYSSYGEYGGNPNSAGVTVSGANSSFVDIVAPNTDVVVTGSGSIFGAVRAGQIDMRGSGDIHFDEALKEVSVAQGKVTPRLDSWQ
ncbi:PilX-like prepilin protein [Onishia taeanensis]|uniref:PilX-like prepilin protein n=1 Tax=Onishia taeanensis TaxID=284577 RepID=A0A328XGA6_9GAMM|nr:pilus assembly PilX N-terminal domain-containing protein [Halomonas taeanensis]RAR58223.1 PilX-like prepilin protein [Halomonas taeanensis]